MDYLGLKCDRILKMSNFEFQSVFCAECGEKLLLHNVRRHQQKYHPLLSGQKVAPEVLNPYGQILENSSNFNQEPLTPIRELWTKNRRSQNVPDRG